MLEHCMCAYRMVSSARVDLKLVWLATRLSSNRRIVLLSDCTPTNRDYPKSFDSHILHCFDYGVFVVSIVESVKWLSRSQRVSCYEVSKRLIYLLTSTSSAIELFITIFWQRLIDSYLKDFFRSNNLWMLTIAPLISLTNSLIKPL